MRVRKILVLLFTCLVSASGWSQELILNEDLKLKMPDSAVILHSGNSVLFKYEDWVMSHQVLDPKNFYPSIDLTGWMNQFIRRVFGEKDESLPEWILVLAKNQAEAFKIDNKSIIKFSLNEKPVYATYSDKLNQGHIFLLNDGYVNNFNIISDKQMYMKFIAILKD